MKLFSPSTQSFYPSEMQVDYEATGTWPSDGVEVSDDIFIACIEARAVGKIITADADGKPVISDPPPPTTEQLSATALAQRDSMLRKASMRVAPLQDAVDLGIATDEEKSELTSWKKYRVDLNRIEEQSGFPQTIDWPQPPE